MQIGARRNRSETVPTPPLFETKANELVDKEFEQMAEMGTIADKLRQTEASARAPLPIPA
jgi:hypothetical protein